MKNMKLNASGMIHISLACIGSGGSGLSAVWNSVVRVIGVTGSSVDMDVYGIDPEKLLKDEQGIIEAVSLSEGITATEVARIAEAKRIVEVDYAELEGKKRTACARERWAGHD